MKELANVTRLTHSNEWSLSQYEMERLRARDEADDEEEYDRENRELEYFYKVGKLRQHKRSLEKRYARLVALLETNLPKKLK